MVLTQDPQQRVEAVGFGQRHRLAASAQPIGGGLSGGHLFGRDGRFRGGLGTQRPRLGRRETSLDLPQVRQDARTVEVGELGRRSVRRGLPGHLQLRRGVTVVQRGDRACSDGRPDGEDGEQCET